LPWLTKTLLSNVAQVYQLEAPSLQAMFAGVTSSDLVMASLE
jgi:hypothetical protein